MLTAVLDYQQRRFDHQKRRFQLQKLVFHKQVNDRFPLQYIIGTYAREFTLYIAPNHSDEIPSGYKSSTPLAWAAPEACCGGEGPRRPETAELEGPEREQRARAISLQGSTNSIKLVYFR